MVPVFAVGSPLPALALMLAAALLAAAARLPFRSVFPRPGFLVFLLVIIVAAQMLFRHGGDGRYILRPLFPEWLPVVGGFGLDGLLAGITIACRVVALAVLMPVLVLTTEPRLLAFGLTRLGANYRVAHVVTATLNLVRSFEEEVALIMDARRLRGVNVGRGIASVFARLSEYRAVALPLMIKVMRRSADVALALDSRAFGAYRTRTWLVSSRPGFADFASLALGVLFCAAVLLADRLPVR